MWFTDEVLANGLCVADWLWGLACYRGAKLIELRFNAFDGRVLCEEFTERGEKGANNCGGNDPLWVLKIKAFNDGCLLKDVIS